MYLHERKDAIDMKLASLLVICHFRYSLQLPPPKVEYVTGVRYAGKAYIRENRIVLCQDFLEKNFDDMVNETLPHELAHLVAFKLFPKCKPHGFVWQSIMIEWFNVPPLRCHNYDTRPQKVDLSDLLG